MVVVRGDGGLVVSDFPGGLGGVFGCDVVLPSGEFVYLRGCGVDVSVRVQCAVDFLFGCGVGWVLGGEGVVRLAVGMVGGGWGV